MKDKTLLKGLRTRATYDKLAGYLDGRQETIKYPDRLATQLQNSYQISNLVDSDGEGWFKQNLKQMRNFTEQQVQDIVNKANLQPQQTMSTQQERIKQVVQPKETPRSTPQAHDLFDTDLDERVQQQHQDIEDQYAFDARQIQERENRVAPRFREALGTVYSAWPNIFMGRRDSMAEASLSGITTIPPTTGAAASVDTKSIAGETPIITPWRVKPPPKRKPGRPSNEEREARRKAELIITGEKTLDAIAEARLRDKALNEARARAERELTYNSAGDNPFSTDDEGMKEKTITKRAGSDKETPQKGVGKKKRKIHRTALERLTGEVVKPTVTPKLTAQEAQIQLLMLPPMPTPRSAPSQAPRPAPTPRPIQKPKPKAKAVAGVKKDVLKKKPTQLTPSQMGIQGIREIFEELKNKGKLQHRFI